MWKITYANNFIRVFRLPKIFPSGYCFGGGYPATFQLVDWFNPFDQQDFWEDKVKEFDEADPEYLKHIEELKTFIKEKLYFDSNYTYMALTDYGDVFLINPEERSDDLQKQYEDIRQKVVEQAKRLNSD